MFNQDEEIYLFNDCHKLCTCHNAECEQHNLLFFSAELICNS
jgi:hypothetical protein